MMEFPNICGLKVIVNDSVFKRRRTWKERLFSFPWNPFKKHNIEHLIKDGQCISFIGGSIVMNSKTRQDLLMELELNEPAKPEENKQ